jgi:hypothetical protein
MPIFEIIGADKKTGDERRLNITADSEVEAEKRAQSMGMLLASVAKLPNPNDDLDIAENGNAVVQPQPYAGIIHGAKSLRFMAAVVFFAAVIFFLLAGLALAFALGSLIEGHHESMWTTIGWAVESIIAGLMFIVIAFLLGMIASAGEALRDIAIKVCKDK